MPAEGNTISCELDVISAPSDVFKPLSSHLLNNLNMLVSWSKYRESVQRAKMWALLFRALTWKGFLPNASNPVLFLLQESDPLGQKPMFPRKTTCHPERPGGQIIPPSEAKSVFSEHRVQWDHLAWSPRSRCCLCPQVQGPGTWRLWGRLWQDHVSGGVFWGRNSMVYACWKKRVHSYATLALALHVVLLWWEIPAF